MVSEVPAACHPVALKVRGGKAQVNKPFARLRRPGGASLPVRFTGGKNQKITCKMDVYMSTTATEVMPAREKP